MTGLAAARTSGAPVVEATRSPGGICSSYYVRPGTTERLARPPADDEAYRFELGGGHWIFGGDADLLAEIEHLSPTRSYQRRAGVVVQDPNDRVPYPLQHHLPRARAGGRRAGPGRDPRRSPVEARRLGSLERDDPRLAGGLVRADPRRCVLPPVPPSLHRRPLRVDRPAGRLQVTHRPGRGLPGGPAPRAERRPGLDRSRRGGHQLRLPRAVLVPRARPRPPGPAARRGRRHQLRRRGRVHRPDPPQPLVGRRSRGPVRLAHLHRPPRPRRRADGDRAQPGAGPLHLDARGEHRSRPRRALPGRALGLRGGVGHRVPPRRLLRQRRPVVPPPLEPPRPRWRAADRAVRRAGLPARQPPEAGPAGPLHGRGRARAAGPALDRRHRCDRPDVDRGGPHVGPARLHVADRGHRAPRRLRGPPGRALRALAVPGHRGLAPTDGATAGARLTRR